MGTHMWTTTNRRGRRIFDTSDENDAEQQELEQNNFGANCRNGESGSGGEMGVVDSTTAPNRIFGENGGGIDETPTSMMIRKAAFQPPLPSFLLNGLQGVRKYIFYVKPK